jgi:hypothetical protein
VDGTAGAKAAPPAPARAKDIQSLDQNHGARGDGSAAYDCELGNVQAGAAQGEPQPESSVRLHLEGRGVPHTPEGSALLAGLFDICLSGCVTIQLLPLAGDLWRIVGGGE